MFGTETSTVRATSAGKKNELDAIELYNVFNSEVQLGERRQENGKSKIGPQAIENQPIRYKRDDKFGVEAPKCLVQS